MVARNRQAPNLRKPASQNFTRNLKNGYGRGQSTNYRDNSGTFNRPINTKVYLMGIPCPGKYVKSILLTSAPEEKNKAKVKFVTTEIQLTGLLIDNAQLWSTNSSRLLAALEESFQYVPSCRGIAQMRVTLGSFSFEQYRRPKDSQNGYSFDEFSDMLSQSITKGHITLGLPIDQLVNQISQASETFILENGQSPISTASRSVKIEFPPKNKKSIHLEVDFQASGGHFEKVRTRWVEFDFRRPPAETRPILEAVMLNPERADLEFKIKEKPILEPGQLDSSMRDVQAHIRFGPFGNDTIDSSLLTPPRRHSMLPIDAHIFRLSEKSTVQYPIKDTDYVLEIARYDVYYPKPNRARRAADSTSYLEFNPPTSFSEAILYGQSWDEGMKAIGKIQDTGSFNFNSALGALFKPVGKETPRDAFERFIMIATNVACIWNATGLQQMESIPRPSSTPRTTMAKPVSVNEGILIDLD